jgi:phage repressor protein C with HTH and peptisase S24 domain
MGNNAHVRQTAKVRGFVGKEDVQEQQRAWIRAVCTRLRISTTQLARMAGVSASTLNRFMKGGPDVKHVLSSTTLDKLTKAIEEADGASEVRTGKAQSVRSEDGIVRLDPASRRREFEIPRSIRDLPVRGEARGAIDGLLFNEGVVREWVERPGNLTGVENGYAVYMNGSCMEPRIKHGELVHVNPNRPLVAGKEVVVELTSHHGFIKLFVKQTAETLTLEQLNPPQVIEIPMADVLNVHRVVGVAFD